MNKNIIKKSTKNMTHEEWLEERRHSIGGSEMGAVLGLSKYESAYSIWAKKIGGIDDDEDNEAMRQGRDLESYVAARFEEISGKNCLKLNAILRNKKYPFIHANIDRKIIGECSGLECKTASALSVKNFQNGDFPEHYYAQCVTYLAVTEYDRWYLAVLILGKGFKVYQLTTIENDVVPEWCESSVYVSKEEIAALVSAAKTFWNYVETKTPPPLDGTGATTDTLSTLYPISNEEMDVDLLGCAALFEKWQQLSEKSEEIEQEKEKIKQEIMSEMQEAAYAHCQDYRVTWKELQPRKTFDYKEYFKAHPEAPSPEEFFKTGKASRPFKIVKKD